MASLVKPLFNMHEVKLISIYGRWATGQLTKLAPWGLPALIGGMNEKFHKP